MHPNNKTSSVLPMVIIGILFFMFGFVTWLNGSLIPFLQIACELNRFEAYFVTLAFYISYTVMALPMALILRRTGYKQGMVLGLLVMVAGALLFIPAAMVRLYSVFLLALFVLGAGLTLLQTAANPYVVMIGPRASAAVRISIMGVLNKGAGVVAPLVFTAFVLTGMGEFTEVRLAALSAADKSLVLAELSARLIVPYVTMAGLLVVLALFVKVAPLREPAFEAQESDGAVDVPGILRHPPLILGAITLFFYVGAEVIAGDTIGLFGKELGVKNFGQLTAYTMAFMVSGYLIGILVIPRWISQARALAASALVGIIVTLLLLGTDPASSAVWHTLFAWTRVPAVPDVVLYVALFGLANALVWPTVWPLALSGLSPGQISTGSALLIMGISGGAILPVVYGALAEHSGGSQAAYWIMLPCYGLVLFFALKGHTLREWRVVKK